MMSDAVNTTVPLLFENMMKTYLPSVDPDGFDAAYPEASITEIHAKLQEATTPRPPDSKDKRRKEKIISEAWVDTSKDGPLCPGYLLNISENHADVIDTKKYKVDGALISTCDKHLIQAGRPNFFLDDLSIEFKRGGTENDAWDDRTNKNVEASADSRIDVRGQLMSYGERHFYFQHRTGLFMLLVNGGEFRVIRWDRSGCIVTEALNYVDTVEHSKKLLQFLYAYSKAEPAQRGFDTTATRLSKDSCGWQWMQKVAAAHRLDLAYGDGTVVQSVPQGFVIKPTRDAPDSPLFSASLLADDPTATAGFGDLSSSSATSAIVPVFKYVRDLFRESLSEDWLCYSLKVLGCDYLVGKPIFAPHGLVGRGTRGYVALEWKTQRLVFLKDAWRPFYHGVGQEGTTLKIINDAGVRFIPTLVSHGDVGGGQETEASGYSSTGPKEPDVFVGKEKEKKDRAIAPMPSRPNAGSGSGTTTTRRTRTSSGSDGSRIDTTASADSEAGQHSGGHSAKRPRSQEAAPVDREDELGLRHLTHYRIVVAEVCLPSTAFTSGRQLARVFWNCINGHGEAKELCHILHRDVSTGNILILPTLLARPTGGFIVTWVGVLSDWELAKKVLEEDEQLKARQPHRTGTWYYMSVHSLTHPRAPVSMADELESFLHAFIYLSVRFLRSDFANVGLYMEKYFVETDLDENCRLLCSELKQQTVIKGELYFRKTPIQFISNPSTSAQGVRAPGKPTPLNKLIKAFLACLKARYTVLDYEEASTKRTVLATYGLLEPAGAAEEDQQLALLDAMEALAPIPAPPAVHIPTESAIEVGPVKPSDDVYRTAEQLDTYHHVSGLFRSHIALGWDSEYVGDQLKGYLPRSYKRSKKACLESTMATIVEDCGVACGSSNLRLRVSAVGR
ncbi:hypothetical protein LXA43DRAFT_929927 [Ganoderma leucocontextum]|nr:hypothetical protein LXA43DRAFT_929927 [Ganoderma leucocontextum]